ncbi:MAG TPA: DNA/RNA nuclease SfsA [Clostridiales bacterium]|nr:DNA/RNA nuclease SfsA [Clostridiales bacterium]HPP34905.1 DNA/RNA nuclease SfsA [Clostridiales bacterium]
MKYDKIIEGKFISRSNRFVAYVSVGGMKTKAHVKNTGRLKELLVDGATVYLQKHDDPKRNTALSLIAVKKGDQIVNIDSQAPNKAMHEWLKGSPEIIIGTDEKISAIRPEYGYRDSRFDFLIETDKRKILMEVKGVTLEEKGTALFPDAPTERGVRHITELCGSMRDGYYPVIAFVIQMDGVRQFSPNAKTHKEFADALVSAHEQGVCIIALDCEVTRGSMVIRDFVDIVLQQT